MVTKAIYSYVDKKQKHGNSKKKPALESQRRSNALPMASAEDARFILGDLKAFFNVLNIDDLEKDAEFKDSFQHIVRGIM